MEYTLQEGFFPSANQTDEIFYRIMTPREIPMGIVLLIHGMRSHSGCYESVATYLCENGYVVCAYDLAGHGRSVGEGGKFGTFAEKDGDVVLVKDMHTMVTIIRGRYRHLPFFVYGHSLGSFVARAYLAAHPDTLDGAIFSGTCERLQFSFWKKRKLTRLVKKAGRSPSFEVENLMLGGFNSAFPEEGSWVTTNTSAFLTKSHDPLGNYPMCADGFYDIFRLMSYISSDDWIKEIPKNLPFFFLSGERDPLGGAGEGIRALVDDLIEAGVSDVSYRLYQGEKHETLGSLSDALVKEDMLRWLKEKTEETVALQRTDLFGSFAP